MIIIVIKKIMVYLLVIIFIIIPLFFLSLYENPIMVQQIYKKYRWVIKNRPEGGISLFRLNLEIEVIYFQHFQYKDVQIPSRQNTQESLSAT